MGLPASVYRKLAKNCVKEAELTEDDDGKQMLLDIARLYTQTALQIETREASPVVQGPWTTRMVSRSLQ
jgi:hypothetical protein